MRLPKKVKMITDQILVSIDGPIGPVAVRVYFCEGPFNDFLQVKLKGGAEVTNVFC